MRILTLITGLLLLSGHSLANDGEQPFSTIDNPEEHIEAVFTRAKAAEKKVLLVLGGNWCHDSISLAEKLDSKSLKKVISSHFDVSMIDVGYLTEGFAFTRLAAMQTYYATPTVLIFDPNTGEHINADNMHQWANAYQISESDAFDYFRYYGHEEYKSEQTSSKTNDAAADVARIKAIKDFQFAQELRIRQGFAIVGPMLKAYKQGNSPEQFEVYWQALANLRMQLPKDLQQLHEQLNANQEFTWPTYEPLPWEATAAKNDEST